MNYLNWIIMGIFLGFISMMVMCSGVANAHDVPMKRLTDDERAQFRALPQEDKNKIIRVAMMKVTADHMQEAIAVGDKLSRAIETCQIPLTSVEDFEAYIMDYLAKDLIDHYTWHAVDILENFYYPWKVPPAIRKQIRQVNYDEFRGGAEDVLPFDVMFKAVKKQCGGSL